MHPRRFVWIWLVLALVLIVLVALALFSDPAAAQSDDPSGPDAIVALVSAMEDAVVAQDRDAYLDYVDLSDPVFRSEHTYWIDDWAENGPLDRFDMAVDAIVIEGDSATARLTITWVWLPDTSYRQAEFPARFVQNAAGAWLFAGGAWETLETDHFLVHVFPGMEPVAEDLIAMLPDIYDHATDSLDYTPETVMHIKLYDDVDDMGVLTALSLPPFGGWNEPGESLKMLVQPGELPSAAVITHELTHFLTFEMAGTTQGNYPWWALEGIAEYVASDYWSDTYRVERLEAVQYWAAMGRLAPWDEISDFESTPLQLWRYVYPQGYAFVRYVTETYGTGPRNDWINAMAGDSDLAAASESAFGVTLDALSAGFEQWVSAAD